MNIKNILFFNGIVIITLAQIMILPMLVDLYLGQEEWKVFFISFVITSFFGGSLTLINNSRSFVMSSRDIFLLIVSSWISVSIFASLPFHFSTMNIPFTDSFFESISGITTTGSTVLLNLHELPSSLLIWRSLLQWMGGLAIIISAISVLPYLNVGGMQLFRSEISDHHNTMPRIEKLALIIFMLYSALTMICAVLYILAGMSVFDGVSYAMTTISTGGFSTHDESLSYFNSAFIELIAIAFMIIGSLPFVLYLKIIKGNTKPLFRDEQVQWFISIIILSIITLSSYLWLYKEFSALQSIRYASFSVVSMTTGTSFSVAHFDVWGSFSTSLLFFLMLIGGCAGSTACGIKMFRFKVLYEIIAIQTKRLLYPNGIFRADFNGKPIPADVPFSIMSFFFLYALCCVIIALMLSLTGLNFEESISAAVTSVSNSGFGFGQIGPGGHFQAIPEAAKWVLCAGMLIGRLEIVTVMVLFTPYFWRR